MRGVIGKIRNYLLAITWCYAVYRWSPDDRQYKFVIGFWNEQEARDYIDEQEE